MAHRHHQQLLHPKASNIIQSLATSNEQTWLLIGRVAEQMGDLEHALNAYENALRHNPSSVSGLTQVAGIARIKENYAKAVDYFQRVLQIEEENGEIWSALGHCYLMQDDLQKAYSAYQQALYLLPNPKEDPKLWYGIGILYDRYGSLDHAEEAFTSVLRMCKDLDFDKENEILFRLGIIYKQQGKFTESLECFDHILRNPPSPLALADIWFQIGHVFEQQKNYVAAKDAYERVVEANPGHAKVLQQLGWLYHQDGSTFQSQELAISYLTKSLEADPGDSQSWYLLGRAYMAGQKYNKAYEAYQQAVYRDGRNPTFWCSIGVLYFQINQYRDALDAYSRAIRINPYISEVWFDLGSLYESCNNQITDAIDAYARAAELDPSNHAIAHRLQLLKNAQATGGQMPPAPGPQDVHPTAYASSIVPPTSLSGAPPLMLHGNNRPSFRPDSRGPPGEIALGPAQGRATPPFRGGPPPPVVLDETRHIPSHTPLAPMEIERPPYHNARDYPPRGGPGQSLLLQHPLPPQQQGAPPPPNDDPRNGVHHPQDAYRRAHSRSRSISPQGPPPPHMQQQRPMNGSHRSPSFQASYPPPPPPGGRQGPPPPPPGVGPAMPSGAPPRSPRSASYHRRDVSEPEGWDRRPPSAVGGEHWDGRGPPPPPPGQYQGPPPHPLHPQHAQQGPPPPPPVQMQQGPPLPPPQQLGPGAFYPPRSPRTLSPMEPSPRVGYPTNNSIKGSPMHEQRKFDPRMDAREYEEQQQREREREMMMAREREASSYRPGDRSYPVSPEGLRAGSRPAQQHPQHIAVGGHRASESPMATPVLDNKRRRVPSVKDEMPQQQQFSPSSMTMPMPPAGGSQMAEPASKRRKRGANGSGGSANGSSSGGSKKEGSVERRRVYPKGPGSPADNASSASGSGRSVQPSPTSAMTPRPPSRMVDEDYDEGVGVADVLMGLANYREGGAPPVEGAPSHSPTISSHSGRMSAPSPRPPASHRNSISSHASPPPPSASTAASSQPGQKRALSPGPEDSANKRTRVDSVKAPGPLPRRISSPSAGKRTPLPSTRPSPIPFRTQPTTSHSPEVGARVPGDPFSPPSPSLPVTLPPHPRPIGAGHGSTVVSASSPVIVQQQGPPGVPSIATLPSSPPSSASSPAGDRDEKMHVDVPSAARGSVSPAMSGGARGSMGPPSSTGSASRSPTAMTMKQSQSPPSEKKEA